MAVLFSIIRNGNTVNDPYAEGQEMGNLLYSAKPKEFESSKLFKSICLFTACAKNAIHNFDWPIGFLWYEVASTFFAGVVDEIQENFKSARIEKRQKTKRISFPLLGEEQARVFFQKLELLVSSDPSHDFPLDRVFSP